MPAMSVPAKPVPADKLFSSSEVTFGTKNYYSAASSSIMADNDADLDLKPKAKEPFPVMSSSNEPFPSSGATSGTETKNYSASKIGDTDFSFWSAAPASSSFVADNVTSNALMQPKATVAASAKTEGLSKSDSKPKAKPKKAKGKPKTEVKQANLHQYFQPTTTTTTTAKKKEVIDLTDD